MQIEGAAPFQAADGSLGDFHAPDTVVKAGQGGCLPRSSLFPAFNHDRSAIPGREVDRTFLGRRNWGWIRISRPDPEGSAGRVGEFRSPLEDFLARSDGHSERGVIRIGTNSHFGTPFTRGTHLNRQPVGRFGTGRHSHGRDVLDFADQDTNDVHPLGKRFENERVSGRRHRHFEFDRFDRTGFAIGNRQAADFAHGRVKPPWQVGHDHGPKLMVGQSDLIVGVGIEAWRMQAEASPSLTGGPAQPFGTQLPRATDNRGFDILDREDGFEIGSTGDPWQLRASADDLVPALLDQAVDETTNSRIIPQNDDFHSVDSDRTVTCSESMAETIDRPTAGSGNSDRATWQSSAPRINNVCSLGDDWPMPLRALHVRKWRGKTPKSTKSDTVIEVGHDSRIPDIAKGCVLSIGKFDGVHLGHQALANAAKKLARRSNSACMAVTFDPLPLAILRPEIALGPPLTPLNRKIELLKRFGFDEVAVFRTGHWLLDLEAREFFDRIVIEKFEARGMVEGSDFSFGRNRSGDSAMLARWCRESGLSHMEVPPILSDGVAVTSSRVRKTLESVDIGSATKMLGHHLSTRGVAVRGAGRGRSISVPTANLADCDTILPKQGVYAAAASIIDIDDSSTRRTWVAAAVNVGNQPTFGSQIPRLEAHLVGHPDRDLYGSTIELIWFEKLRETQRFDSVEALKRQLSADIDLTVRVFASHANDLSETSGFVGTSVNSEKFD